MKKLLSLIACLAIAVPALAAVTVSSPINGETVGSPFRLSANASWCSGQWIAAIGYSIDNSTSTTTWKNNAIDVNVSLGQGWHTIHVKSWGYQGSVCVTDVKVDVTGTTSTTTSATTTTVTSSGGPYIPSNATSNSALQTLSNWKGINDTGTGGGWTSGTMSMVGWPTQSGPTRKFATTFGNAGGERYYVTYGDDAYATNFVYDGWVYVDNSASVIANLEMDLNQVMPNGQTVIYGFQCDGYTSTWDYTANSGTPTSPKDVWVHSHAYCNPRAWGRNRWHHVQISYSRDNYGYVTYHSVWLDGQQQAINAKVRSAFALGWGQVLLTNFQVDGLGSGPATATVYLDNLKIYRW